MAKTLAQMWADSREIFGQTDSTDSNISDSTLTKWANEAYRKICTALRDLPIKIRDYTSASGTITLNSNTITIDTAKIYDDDQAGFLDLEVISLDRLLQIDPDYENADTGKCKYFARTGTFAAVLYPPPDSTQTSNILRVSGLETPTELSVSTDTPDLPGNLHDIFANWIAHRAFLFLNNPSDAVAQLTIFRGGLRDAVGVSRETSRHSNKFSWAPSDGD